MLSAPSQVLLRNADIFSQGRWLLVNPADSNVFNELDNPDVYGFHQYFDIYQQCQQQAEKHEFAAFYPSEKQFDGIVIYMPKAKALLKMLLAHLAPLIKAGGSLMLVGENNSGVKSAAKLMHDFGSTANKVDSARHCSLFSSLISEPAPAFVEGQYLHTQQVDIQGKTLEVKSLPGVFSFGELDAATELLLQNLPERIGGFCLDFGCGAGLIGCFIAKYFPNVQMQMTDVSALAIYSAKATATANDLQVDIVPSNGLSHIKGKFKQVFTNPPFHTGIKTDYSVTENFLRQLPAKMQDGSKLTLVANSFLQYPEMMQRSFNTTEVIAQTNKFKLYQCRAN